ncbi:hypothetical protein [Ligilactobacillus equi]|uniref:Phage protein n=1 Tax=Ligilactobacillus equi DPC 6820 TaxID=1392007 RepID=V7HXE2_9LACO|nr:hypothetical protein [Ligilactobacillus equi]ETA73858.1 hypothetical protein LEQ_2213c [Ligilactobacillus equi DPC 6820]
MQDALSEIYNVLMADQMIEQAVLNNGKHAIHYYQEPAGTLPKTLILIRPYQPPEPTKSMSNEAVQQEVIVQIDVQSVDRMTCKMLQAKVEEDLRTLGFLKLNGQGLDEYFAETKHFVDARRYRLTTKLYETRY